MPSFNRIYKIQKLIRVRAATNRHRHSSTGSRCDSSVQKGLLPPFYTHYYLSYRLQRYPTAQNGLIIPTIHFDKNLKTFNAEFFFSDKEKSLTKQKTQLILTINGLLNQEQMRIKLCLRCRWDDWFCCVFVCVPQNRPRVNMNEKQHWIFRALFVR